MAEPALGTAPATRLGEPDRSVHTAAHAASSSGQTTGSLTVWRHPKPIGAAGRCIGGRTDLAVDSRKAKRLAHRIRRHARQQRLPREVWTSPLRRAADVGVWLARWGWRHRVDAALVEADFGAWDGQHWDDIGEPAITAWCADFAAYDAHGGESVAALFARCTESLVALSHSAPCCVVAHAGWINAARRLCAGQGVPSLAIDWPASVGYGSRLDLPVSAALQRAPATVSEAPTAPISPHYAARRP